MFHFPLGEAMNVKTHISIAVPFALGALIMAAAPLRAEGPMPMAEALRVLAQANAMDARCHFLNTAEHAELSGYAAKAEVISAGRMGVAAASRAVAAGEAAGRQSACDAANGEIVHAALVAAREAIRHAPARRQVAGARKAQAGQRRAAAPERVELRPRRKARPRVVAVIAPKPARAAAPARSARAGSAGAARGKSGAVRRYVALTTDYYRKLRCRNVDRGHLLALYRKVRAAHFALIRSAGGRATARAKARARAMAARRSCRSRLAAR